MTAIHGYVPPTTDEAAVGIHSLDQFVLSVPDLKTAQHFYGTFGLDVREKDNSLLLHTFDHEHRWGSVTEGTSKCIHHLSFGCYADDLPRLKARIEGNGVKLLDPPAGFESNGIWFRNADGILNEVKVAPKSSPNQKVAGPWHSCPEGVAGAPDPQQGVDGATAAAVPCPVLHTRHRPFDRVLCRESRLAPV